ncbi:MAG: carotenoid biosynthesis protein, partial [Chloroflexota bacterium]
TWEVDGAYFGVPLQNYWGWWLTTFVTLTLFLLPFRGTGSRPDNPSLDRLAVIAYALTGIGEISGALVLGHGGPALAGFFAMSPWVILGWMATREQVTLQT